MSASYRMIGGSLGQEDDPDVSDGVLPDPARGPIRLGAKVQMSHVENDVVHDVEITGVVGRITVYEPGLEERRQINAQAVGQIFSDEMWDVHDLKEILRWAIDGLLTAPMTTDPETAMERKEMFQKLEKVHHALGGFD